jgi:hypothetical protein
MRGRLMTEPPYEEISNLLNEGRVIPLLGAGVNFGARPAGAEYQEKDPAFLPSGAELSRILARRCNFPLPDDHDRSDLAKVTSYFAETTGRRNLRRGLHKVFDRDYQTCTIHTYLAGISSPLLLMTTNYDDLMECALRKAGRPFDLVVHPTDRMDVLGCVLWTRHGAAEPEAKKPNDLLINLDTTTVVYKMHGTVDRKRDDGDSYVITEDDYVDFLARMIGQNAVPAKFMRHCHGRHFLFMGYGLRDWNLRVLLKNLKSLPASGTAGNDDGQASGTAGNDDGQASGASGHDDYEISWAIQHNPSDLERKLWRSRNVDLYNVDINQFVERLASAGPEPRQEQS